MAVPLCNRANCSHRTADCPGFIDIDSVHPKMFYIDGNLYLSGRSAYNSCGIFCRFGLEKISEQALEGEPMKLEIVELSKSYKKGKRALDCFTATLTPGVYGLLGPNGAGS